MAANTIYLFHADGANGDKPATEDGPNSATLVWSGTAALSTSQAKFGTSSLKVGGSSAARVEWLHGAGGLILTGDLTIDYWIHYTAHGVWHSNLNWWGGGAKQIFTMGYIDQPGWGFEAELLNVSNTLYYLYSGTAATNAWHHLAYVRQGRTHQLFFNGVLQDTKTCQFTSFGDTTTCYWTWGGRNGSGWNYPQECHLDEIRISDIARYTANFTVETAPYSLGPPPSTAVASVFDGGLKLNLDMDI